MIILVELLYPLCIKVLGSSCVLAVCYHHQLCILSVLLFPCWPYRRPEATRGLRTYREACKSNKEIYKTMREFIGLSRLQLMDGL